PLVSADYYNKNLYQGGKGLFPVPLRETYQPPPNEDPLKPVYNGMPQLLLREGQFPNMDAYPIFGALFKDKGQLAFLNDLPVRRYFPVPRTQWRPEPGRDLELA